MGAIDPSGTSLIPTIRLLHGCEAFPIFFGVDSVVLCSFFPFSYPITYARIPSKPAHALATVVLPLLIPSSLLYMSNPITDHFSAAVALSIFCVGHSPFLLHLAPCQLPVLPDVELELTLGRYSLAWCS